MPEDDPINHAGIHINKLTYLLNFNARLLASDLSLLHSEKTRKGKPYKIWYKGARKRVEALRELLEMADEDLNETGKHWPKEEE